VQGEGKAKHFFEEIGQRNQRIQLEFPCFGSASVGKGFVSVICVRLSSGALIFCYG
jgi:hypothetical protein